MKSTSLLAVVAVLFSVAASAQTGRPSTVEVQGAADATHVVAADEELGAYGRYLMLNGVTREEAVAAARNVDHPADRAARPRIVATQLHARTRTDAPAPTRQ